MNTTLIILFAKDEAPMGEGLAHEQSEGLA